MARWTVAMERTTGDSISLTCSSLLMWCGYYRSPSYVVSLLTEDGLPTGAPAAAADGGYQTVRFKKVAR